MLIKILSQTIKTYNENVWFNRNNPIGEYQTNVDTYIAAIKNTFSFVSKDIVSLHY